MRAPLHDANGRFAPGNPGRPKGSRNPMTNRLAMGLLDDMLVNEEGNIAKMRRSYFPQYVQLMSRFIPREIHRPRPDFADYAPAETQRLRAAARAALEAPSPTARRRLSSQRLSRGRRRRPSK